MTRQDWISSALAALAEVPIDQLRVQSLAGDLSVSRSSFYWYFKDPEELRSELLALWSRNTASIVDRSERETSTVVAACLGVFECWADGQLYDATLDLAVRDWGRRDAEVALQVNAADTERQEALTAMFARHGFADDDAVVRARLLYQSQVGYYAVGTSEPISQRMAYLPYYLEAIAGARATPAELRQFEAVVVDAQKAR